MSLVILGSPLAAQSAQQAARVRSATDTMPVLPRLATITTDTGDLAPGPRSFTRYLNPLWCVIAAQIRLHELQTSLEAQLSLDTLRFTPERDTLPTEVGTIARSCGARFTVAGTAVADLPTLFQLAMLAGQDSVARAVVERRVTLAPTPAVRWAVMSEAIDGYLQAEPARLAAVDTLLVQLEREGAPALVALTHAHRQLLKFDYATQNRVRMRREAERLLAVIPHMTESDLEAGGADDAQAAWQYLLILAEQDPSDSLPVVAERLRVFYLQPLLQHYLQALQRTPGGAAGTVPTTLADAPLAVVLRHFVYDQFLFDSARAVQDIYAGQPGRSASGPPGPGRPTPPLHVAYWFPVTPGDTVQPAPGRVSLIVNTFDWDCLYRHAELLGGLGQCNLTNVIRLRRLLQRYGPAGLSVTLFVAIPAEPSSVLEREPQPAATVAQVIARYVHEALRLPVTVAVDTVSLLQQVPAPDGRKFYSPSALDRQYYDSGAASGLAGHRATWEKIIPQTTHSGWVGKHSQVPRWLVQSVTDRHGTMVWLSNAEDIPDDLQFHTVIERALANRSPWSGATFPTAGQTVSVSPSGIASPSSTPARP